MKHMRSESDEFETENSPSRVVWLLLYFMFASRAHCHCKTVAPFCLGFGLRAEECPQSQENPRGDLSLSLKTMSIGDTVRSPFLIARPRMGFFFPVVQPEKTLAARAAPRCGLF